MSTTVFYDGDADSGEAFVVTDGSYRRFNNSTPTQLAGALPDDAVIIVPTTTTSEGEIPAGTADAVIPQAIIQVAREARDADRLRTGAAVVRGVPAAGSRRYVTASVLEDLAAAFGSRKVVPSALAFTRPGTYLSVGFTNVELVHVAPNPNQTPGVHVAGYGRVDIEGLAGLQEPQIGAYADRLAEAVSNAMRDSLVARGSEVSALTIVGVGAGLAQFISTVAEYNVIGVHAPEGGPPQGEPSTAWAAWQPAALDPEALPPEAFVKNPVVESDRANAKVKRQRLAMRGALGLAAVLLLAVATVPYLNARVGRSNAKADWEASVDEFSQVADLDLAVHVRNEGTNLLVGLEPAEVDWSAAIGWLLIDTPPQGTTWRSVNLVRDADDDGTITVLASGQASVGGISFDELSLWLAQLEESGLEAAWIDSFAQIDGNAELDETGLIVDPGQTGTTASIQIQTGWVPPVFPFAPLPEGVEEVPEVEEAAPTGDDPSAVPADGADGAGGEDATGADPSIPSEEEQTP